jgi:hypothetical protein
MAVLFSACGTPGTALLPSIEPKGEVLAYFGPDAPALALVDTDELDGLAGPLAALQAPARRFGLVYAQLKPLLGGELAIGIPRPGAAPLAVLVSNDAGELRALADSRAVGKRAAVAGVYRDARLYAAHGHAFAVRGRVLLVSHTTADLRAALDQRESDDSFKGESLPAARHSPLARVFVDLAPHVGERGRAVAWLSAVETLTAVVRTDAEGATVDFRVPTEADELLEVDVPVSPGKRGPLAVTAGAPALTVRDLAHVLGVAERGARTAFPLAVLRLDQARRTLRYFGKVDLLGDVIARLHGPATFVHDGDALLVRADPSRPRALKRALARLSAVLPAALERARLGGLSTRVEGAFLELRRGDHLVGRVGMVGDVLVAGTGTIRQLRELARAPLARPAGAAGALTVAVPRESTAAITRERLGVSLPWRVDGWARGAREDLRGALRLAW